MRLLNRAVLHVTAAAPLRTWAQTLHDQGVAVNMDFSERSSYLLGDDVMSDLALALAPYVSSIFEHELRWVCRQREYWPTHRSVSTFLAWFDCSCHSLVLDLLDAPLQIEPF